MSVIYLDFFYEQIIVKPKQNGNRLNLIINVTESFRYLKSMYHICYASLSGYFQYVYFRECTSNTFLKCLCPTM